MAEQNEILRRIADREPLGRVLEAIAARVVSESGLPGLVCSFMRFDASRRVLSCAAAPGFDAAFRAALQAVPVGPLEGSCGAAAHLRRPVAVRDVQDDVTFAKYRDFAASYGISSSWSMPVDASDGRLLGTFAVYSREVREPSSSEMALLSEHARLVAIALEREEAEEATARHLEGQRLIAAASTALLNHGHADEPDCFVDALAEVAHFAGADRASVWTILAESETAILRSSWPRRGRGVVGQVFSTEAVGWMADMNLRGDACDVPDVRLLPPEASRDRATFDAAGIGAIYCTPVFVRGVLRACLRLECLGRTHFWDAESRAVAKVVGEILATGLERREADRLLRHQALHDALTGLPNRYALRDRLELLLQTVNKTSALYYVDLDDFKHVNDTLGHAAGDEVLVAAARRLCARAGSLATVARVGGDEFVILVALPADASPATLARQFVTDFEAQLDARGRELATTCSVGVAVAPRDGNDPDSILRAAGLALHAAKTRGGNRWELYDEVLESTHSARLGIARELQTAVNRGEFAMVYQPVVAPRSGAMFAAEALLRWNHPTRGVLSPGSFLAIAEESGALLTIGRWALEAACREAAMWSADGGGPKVAVNLSARELQSSGLADFVRATLDRAGLPPARLEIEITETAALADLQRSRRDLLELKRIGVSIALDDFGTGYASLTYLQGLPIDTLKLDGSFSRHLGQRETNAIVRSVVDLAHGLGIRVVAEGVERPEQLTFLSELGCDGLQGYLLGRPMSGEDLRRRLAA